MRFPTVPGFLGSLCALERKPRRTRSCLAGMQPCRGGGSCYIDKTSIRCPIGPNPGNNAVMMTTASKPTVEFAHPTDRPTLLLLLRPLLSLQIGRDIVPTAEAPRIVEKIKEFFDRVLGTIMFSEDHPLCIYISPLCLDVPAPGRKRTSDLRVDLGGMSLFEAQPLAFSLDRFSPSIRIGSIVCVNVESQITLATTAPVFRLNNMLNNIAQKAFFVRVLKNPGKGGRGKEWPPQASQATPCHLLFVVSAAEHTRHSRHVRSRGAGLPGRRVWHWTRSSRPSSSALARTQSKGYQHCFMTGRCTGQASLQGAPLRYVFSRGVRPRLPRLRRDLFISKKKIVPVRYLVRLLCALPPVVRVFAWGIPSRREGVRSTARSVWVPAAPGAVARLV